MKTYNCCYFSIKGKMPYSSQKHGSFVLEPIGYKSVTQLPGIGAAAEQKLKDAGIEHVSML